MSVLFPFRPQKDIDEDLSFLTTVTRASHGNEVRVNLRQKPRRAFKYSYVKDNIKSIAKIDNALTQSQGSVVDLPIWTDGVHLRGVAQGGITITTGIRHGDFRDGKGVLLWKTDNDYEVLEIESNTATTLTFTTALVNDYPDDVIVVPILAGLLSGTPQRMTKENYQTFSIPFELVDNVAMTGGLFPHTFDGDPVWGGCHIASNPSLTESYKAVVQVFDNQTGIPVLYKDSVSVTHLRSMSFWLEDQEDVQAFRGQCHAVGGRFKRFWLPDHASRMDLHASVTAGASEITITGGDYSTLFAEFPDQRAALYLSNGTGFQAIKILSISSEPLGLEKIVLDGVTSFDLAIGNNNIGFLIRHRLNTDRIRLKHREQTTVAMSAVEVLGA